VVPLLGGNLDPDRFAHARLLPAVISG
jgi:hypothetical protein